MKKTKLLAATAMLLLTSCSPKVVTHIVRTYPNPVPADSVYVIEPEIQFQTQPKRSEVFLL